MTHILRILTEPPSTQSSIHNSSNKELPNKNEMKGNFNNGEQVNIENYYKHYRSRSAYYTNQQVPSEPSNPVANPLPLEDEDETSEDDTTPYGDDNLEDPTIPSEDETPEDETIPSEIENDAASQRRNVENNSESSQEVGSDKGELYPYNINSNTSDDTVEEENKDKNGIEPKQGPLDSDDDFKQKNNL